MAGALIAWPEGDHHIQIDASFPDGYASLALVFEPADPSRPPPQTLQTDLPPELVTDRITAMLELVPLPTGPLEQATRKECMYIFAGVAGACGLAALATPTGLLAAGAVWGCMSGFATGLCTCAKYLPLEIC